MTGYIPNHPFLLVHSVIVRFFTADASCCNPSLLATLAMLSYIPVHSWSHSTWLSQWSMTVSSELVRKKEKLDLKNKKNWLKPHKNLGFTGKIWLFNTITETHTQAGKHQKKSCFQSLLPSDPKLSHWGAGRGGVIVLPNALEGCECSCVLISLQCWFDHSFKTI